jgi:RimJ/RimL family protein N-acetyltransferase
MYRQTGFFPPWIGYLAAVDGQIVGSCAFKSPPREDRVEIAYFTFPRHEGQGIATEMARQLIDIAREADDAVVLTAQTLPEENASTAILRRLGFELVGLAVDPEAGQVWTWERVRH